MKAYLARNIDLARKTQPLEGKMETYWFENPSVGLTRTLFHRIAVPLKPFDSGLEWELQPIDASFVFDWYALGVVNPREIHGLNLCHRNYPDSEASIYIGNAHNPCDVLRLTVAALSSEVVELGCTVEIIFEHEMVARNELFEFTATARWHVVQ